MANFIKSNVEDFQVVVLTAIDSLNLDSDTDGITDFIDYLNNSLGATQDNCSDFTFAGGLFNCLFSFK